MLSLSIKARCPRQKMICGHCHVVYITGFQPLWKSGKSLKNEFPIFQSGKTRGILEKHKTSGESQGICDSDPEGKGFRQFGVMCVLATLNVKITLNVKKFTLGVIIPNS